MPAVSGAQMPFVDDALKSDTAPASSEQPEPSGLTSHWWRYFDVEGEELERRVQETVNRLDQLPQELPQELAASAQPLISLIKTNLQTLPKAIAQASPSLPPPPAYRESYTLRQLFDIATARRQTQTELQIEQEDVETMSKTIRAASRRLDTMMAAYLGLSPSDPNLILRGLEIMAEQSAIAVAEQRLRVRKAVVRNKKTRLGHLKEQQAIAAQRLRATPNDRERLNRQIDETKIALKQAQSQFLSVQSRILSVVGEDPEEKATARYRQQQALRSAVVEAIATVRLIKLQAELHLVELMLDENDSDLRGINYQLDDWEGQLASLRSSSQAWRRASERERERAGELVANAATRDDREAAVTFMGLLNQNRLDLAQETLVTLQRFDSEVTEAGLILELAEEQLLAKAGWLLASLVRIEQVFVKLWDEAAGSVSASLFRIGDAPVTTLGLLRVLVIITLAWWISYWLRRVLKRLGERGDGENLPAFYTVGRLSHYVIIALGFMIGLSSIGIDFTNIALFASALAVGIGFGLQSIVNNFLSGLIILFDRSLKVGDFLELASGVSGEVREIRVRSTVINTNDNVDIVVPNSEFMNTQFINWTLLEAYRRIHIPFKVAFGSDKDLVRKAGLEAAERLPHTLLGVAGRNPGVWLVGFGDSGLNFELVVWVTPRAVKRPGAVHAAYMWEIETALRKHGVEIPLPQRDLHLRSGFQEAERGGRPELPAKIVAPRLNKS